jgi:hypothetical protein
LLSENSGIENGRDFEHGSSPITNLDREILVSRAFHDGLAGSIDKSAERHTVRRFCIQQFNALFVCLEGFRRPEVEKVLCHEILNLLWRLQSGRVCPIVEMSGRVSLSRLPEQFVALMTGRHMIGFVAHGFRERSQSLLQGVGLFGMTP